MFVRCSYYADSRSYQEWRRVILAPCTFTRLTAVIRELLDTGISGNVDAFVIKYEDDEGELISLLSDAELSDAFDELKLLNVRQASARLLIKLHISDDVTTATSPMSLNVSCLSSSSSVSSFSSFSSLAPTPTPAATATIAAAAGHEAVAASVSADAVLAQACGVPDIEVPQVEAKVEAEAEIEIETKARTKVEVPTVKNSACEPASVMKAHVSESTEMAAEDEQEETEQEEEQFEKEEADTIESALVASVADLHSIDNTASNVKRSLAATAERLAENIARMQSQVK